MLEPKLRSLHPSVQAEVQAELQKYDDDISRETAKIAAAHRAIKKKQIKLVDKVGKLLEQHSQPHLSPEPSNPHSGSEESDESSNHAEDQDKELPHNEPISQQPSASAHNSEKDQGDERFVNNLFNFDDAGNVPTEHSLEDVACDRQAHEITIGQYTGGFRAVQKIPYSRHNQKRSKDVDPNLLVDSGVKRTTRAPQKLSSPIKIGYMRTSPSAEVSLRLHNMLCDPHSAYKNLTLMEYTMVNIDGDCIMRSFLDFQETDNSVMEAFVNCIWDDDKNYRPKLVKQRLILHPQLAVCANVENYGSQHNPDAVFSKESLDTAFDLYMTNDIAWRSIKLILIPVIDRGHYSLYAVNFEASRVDVLDTLDYDNAGTTWLYRLTKFSCPIMVRPNDYTFLTMKYAEHYTGVPGCVDDVVNLEKSAELRAEYLYYMLFHPSNKAEIPEDLSCYRITGYPF
ncbi:hypothetical protein QOZ80_7BG0590390 [Eleusine coracana subsp. coracana]|nr:hypothetical protein QOZ80_7BG0590390 [Eleusine coracana subsp. coracana]